MAKLEIPVVIDGVKSIEELANRVLDEYEFKGMTIREWADQIANPKTNGDRIRSMADEELAEWFSISADTCPSTKHERNCNNKCSECWLDWMRQEVTER